MMQSAEEVLGIKDYFIWCRYAPWGGAVLETCRNRWLMISDDNPTIRLGGIFFEESLPLPTTQSVSPVTDNQPTQKFCLFLEIFFFLHFKQPWSLVNFHSEAYEVIK